MDCLLETGMSAHRLRGVFRAYKEYGRDGTLPRKIFIEILDDETRQIRLKDEDRDSLANAFVKRS
jgi:hypothetical protein